MNYAVYNIALDIHKTGTQVALSMIRGESRRKIVISLTENGRPYKITEGCTAMIGWFTAVKPDDKLIYNSCDVDTEKNLITYYVTPQTIAAPGEVKCQIKLIGTDGGLLFSPTFSIIVGDTLCDESDEIIESSNEFNTLTDYVAGLQEKFTTPPYAILCEGAGENITLDDSADAIFKGFKIYGKSTQNGTPTPDAPVDIVSVGDDGGIDADVYGGNLAENIIIRAENINAYSIPLIIKMDLKPSTKYVFSFKGTVGNTYYFNENLFVDYKTFTVQEGVNTFVMTTKSTLPTTYGNDVSSDGWRVLKNLVNQSNAHMFEDVMVNIGEKPLPYQPFTKQSTLIGIENGLRGIPVTDSGHATYTDGNGQMWCADEIDLERGVYVQRVSEYIAPSFFSTGTPNLYFASLDKTRNVINTKVISTHFEWAVSGALASTPIGKMIVRDRTDFSGPVVYCASNIATLDGFNTWIKENNVGFLSILATPIETPLSPEIISQYKELHTNYPNTTILNDENAFMEVEYIADPKTYIKKMSGSTTQISSVTLAASKWVGTASPYSQVVTIPGTTKNSKIDLNPTVTQLSDFHDKDISFVVGNNNGTITVYCIGQKPTKDYTMQVTITEVVTNA